MTYSTITGNVAETGSGGGIHNVTATSELVNTIIAGNTAATGPDCGGDGTLISQANNLVGSGTGCPSSGPGDVTVNPAEVFIELLGPLQNNGGPTRTHALLPDSPALDAGDDAAAPTTDQRGVPRPQGLGSDIGAFEVELLITGDVNWDGIVNVADLRIVAAALGTPGSAGPGGHGLLDVLDLALVGLNFGQEVH